MAAPHRPCVCAAPPFHYTDYDSRDLGQDAHYATVELQRCKHCGRHWLKYLIEEEHITASGRWWRAAISADEAKGMRAEEARAHIERQPRCFAGGSGFDSTGFEQQAPIRIRWTRTG
ncbi:MAG TPA: hypothetical protein VGN52_14700 [Burkholderiales bacterium]|jgi:hypothetical protein